MKKKVNKPSNIYHDRRIDKYYVSQSRDGKKHYYGYYNTLEEAIQRREELVGQGVLLLRPYSKGRPFKEYEDRYIYRIDSGNYVIRKRANKGKQEHFGTFHRLEDAREERDYLENIEWDYDNME